MISENTGKSPEDWGYLLSLSLSFSNSCDETSAYTGVKNSQRIKIVRKLNRKKERVSLSGFCCSSGPQRKNERRQKIARECPVWGCCLQFGGLQLSWRQREREHTAGGCCSQRAPVEQPWPRSRSAKLGLEDNTVCCGREKKLWVNMVIYLSLSLLPSASHIPHKLHPLTKE